MDEPLLIPATTVVLMYHYVRPDDAPTARRAAGWTS